ncbi:MAG: Flp pilus assembly complex ATPase component TadA [Deltaproteobacteria bacterium]|nr:Flp pilus assembly complex ATPase component TadA [Deltaproteobacteria bacterium]
MSEEQAAGSQDMVVGQIEYASPLDSIAIFQPLPAKLKAQLESKLSPRSLRAGEQLFSEGDVGDAMYLVLSGRVSVFVSDKSLGLTHELAQLGSGQAFGEMALITGEARSASVRALDDTELLALSRDIFGRLVAAVPQVALTIAAVLARRLDQHNQAQGIEFGSLRGRAFDPNMLDLVPLHVIQRHRMVPLSAENNVVTVATPNPGNRLGVDDVHRVLRGMDLRLLAVSQQDFDAFVAQQVEPLARKGRQVASVPRNYEALAHKLVYHPTEADEDKSAQASARDVVQMLSAIVVEAIDLGASDIHIEPERNRIAVRYRVDGRLRHRGGTIPVGVHKALVTRIKVLSSLDISERRLPQDGRISVDLGNKSYDLRVASLNTKYGEKVTLRILDSTQLGHDLGSLVLADKVAKVVRQFFYHPNGLVLVTGPTGSGKTTTLYAAIKERHNPELSICTVEDPIEYDVPGISQVQVNEAIGLGFADVMRAFLRQDPNIILVGETRDTLTAKMACNAALTGHLVLSSFHTNDTVSAIIRLREMEVEPFVLSEALVGVVNQRLIRRICPSCRRQTAYSDLILQNLKADGVEIAPGSTLWTGAGCQHCNGDGFKGRVGVFEVLAVNQSVREAIARGASASEIERAAAGAFVPLASFASFLLREGLTVPSEVLRILSRA